MLQFVVLPSHEERVQFIVDKMQPRQLKDAPHHLAVLTSKLEHVQLSAKADPESWSANEILAHLRVCGGL